MSVMPTESERRPSRIEPAVALLALAFVMLLGFQLVQLVRESGTIKQVRAGQEQPMQEGTRLRGQLNAIAGKTAALADGGNASAKAIIDEMRKLGISVKPTP